MHERLFAHQNALNPGDLSSHALALSLDVAAFQGCIEGGQTASVIRKELEEGRKLGVRSTPTFLLGLTEADGSTVRLVKLLRGARVYSAFKTAIDGVLAENKE